MGFVRLDEKRIEDENEYKYEYDDDIIAGCVLAASNRRGERWIALLVNFSTNIKIELLFFQHKSSETCKL